MLVKAIEVELGCDAACRDLRALGPLACGGEVRLGFAVLGLVACLRCRLCRWSERDHCHLCQCVEFYAHSFRFLRYLLFVFCRFFVILTFACSRPQELSGCPSRT